MIHSAASGGRACREDAHALYPQSEVAQDALDDLPVVDERDDAHFTGTFRLKPECTQPTQHPGTLRRKQTPYRGIPRTYGWS